MSSIRYYLERAAECRKLAAAARETVTRQLLIETAETWEFLARESVRPRLSLFGK